MKTKTLLLCSVVLTLSACSPYSGPRYVPRADVAQRDYTTANHTEDRMDKKLYKQYERREPCQNYRDLPRKMIDKCVVNEEKMELSTVSMSRHTEEQQKVLPIVSSYTVLFDHDQSNIRDNESETLDRAMREIDKYEPTQVTVTGYTDSSGTIKVFPVNVNRPCRRHCLSAASITKRWIAKHAANMNRPYRPKMASEIRKIAVLSLIFVARI